MESIFIDTSIFVAENFLEGNRIKELYRLFKEKRFKNVMPLITVNEIKSQFRNRIETAIEEHNRVMNLKAIYVLKNYKKGKEMLSKFPKADIVAEGFNNEFDKLLKEAGTEIIPYPTLDTTILFDNYFKGEKPFGKGDKKHEFPDAIAIESLKQWCISKKQKCIVLASDGDFKTISDRRLRVKPDYKDFLDKTLKDILIQERKEIVEILFNKNKIKLETDIELWLRNSLDDTSLYVNAANWLEIHDIQILLVAVSIKTYQITSIENEIIKAEITAVAEAEIELEIDDESTAYRDPDDKNFYYTGTSQLNFKEEFEIPLAVEFMVVNKEEFDDEIEIKEFNDGEELEISYSQYDY